ncbi:hypothetical protein MACJ_000562 [Theileria orientalis]|uniref:Uncharacterized protein n=1 Tax=Theileria orientalis TaxID=68886 RepID=A0A976M494_THEOR|nr:hypothetical protein MACJ_000562 [Theileria orientalis]
MRINSIGKYILVYLLTRKRRNALVPVRAIVAGPSTPSDPGVHVSAVVNDAVASDLSIKSLVNSDDSETDIVKPHKNDVFDVIELDPNDFFSDYFRGNFNYAFKPDVECILVRFDGKDVWKRGEGDIVIPKSVTYDAILREVTVRDANKSVYFKKDNETGEWKHVVTMSRDKKPKVLAKGDSLLQSTSTHGSELSRLNQDIVSNVML